MALADCFSLITEWRIQKRVEEQFNAFVSGFNELIPPDLVNVFDERELELLIGGIADIDVEDWKKHTDYRGYTESDEVIVNFWKVILPLFPKNRLVFTICSVSAAGIRNRNLAFCNSRRGPHGYLLMDLKTFRGAMARGDLPSKKQENPLSCQSLIHGMSNFPE